jgi:L,D-peptidoglycan transpeptidase YkuD (ErfK/YbiS/YcfS/YnhG family)
MPGRSVTVRDPARTHRSEADPNPGPDQWSTVGAVKLRSVGILALAAGLMQSCQPACQPAPGPVCTPPAGVPDSARQVVQVTSSGSTADVALLVNDGSGWQCAALGMRGRVGSNGVRDLAARRSGDGTTPGGIFGVGTMTAPDGQTFQFFGNGANPGVRGAWRQVQAGDCWGATPGTPDYNQLVSRPDSQCNSPDEYLPNIGAYTAAALIDANMGPTRSGDQPGEPALAAAIFLHRHSYNANGTTRATSGCVSLSTEDLARVLASLVPGEAYFVIR